MAKLQERKAEEWDYLHDRIHDLEAQLAAVTREQDEAQKWVSRFKATMEKAVIAASEEQQRAERAEAEVQRLQEALAEIAGFRHHIAGDIAREALLAGGQL